MIREIGKRMNVEVEFVNMGFDGLIPALMTNNIDIVVSGVTITEERKKRVDFCEPYYQAGQGLMIRVGDEAKYQKIEDLHNKTIAVQIGTTGAEVAKGIPGTKIKAFNTSAEAFMDLKMNGSDVVITDRPVIGYFLVTNARAAKGLKRQPMQFDSEYFGFAVKKGNTELRDKVNAAMKSMKDDGTYDKIYAKWFGESAPFEADAENEYITAYKKVHPVEKEKGYSIEAAAADYENYSDFSEWAFDDVKEKEYTERAFFADTEEEARQIILDYQEYLKTNNGGEMEKFLDYMTEQSKTRDDFAY